LVPPLLASLQSLGIALRHLWKTFLASSQATSFLFRPQTATVTQQHNPACPAVRLRAWIQVSAALPLVPMANLVILGSYIATPHLPTLAIYG
ncbi:hypothetical protein FRC11_014125, partial [Ceratobasidium sp. 423]